MLSKCHSSSISTVHFKRQLFSPPTFHFPNKTTTNASKRYESDPSPPPSRLRAPRESTHFQLHDALKISAQMSSLLEAKLLHGHFVKLGLSRNIYLQNQIMSAYFKSSEVNDGHKMLDEMPERNVVVWNTVISSIFGSKTNSGFKLSLSLSHFRTMLLDSARPDGITLNVLLRFSAASKRVEIGRQLHCLAAKFGLGADRFVGTALLDLYSKCGFVQDSRWVFDEAQSRDLFLWNAMVYCYASNGSAAEAARVFNLMRSGGFVGDEFTLTNLLSSLKGSRSCELGKQIHAIAIRRCFDVDVLVASTLVGMYSRGGNLRDARKLFDVMRIRNVVTWNTMIVGYGQHGEAEEAIELFVEMVREEFFSPDELTLASIISSCGNSGVKNELTQVHAYAIKLRFNSFLSTNNALINAYSKCGSIVSAFHCFNLASESDLYTWTSMISAYAFHGLAGEATNCFEKMLTCGISPDKITFLGVLSACSHGGLIDEGLEYFKIMTRKYHIAPDPKHYTCLVDLVARSGLLDEAFAILNAIPMIENALGAFLGACQVHGNLRLAGLAAEKVLALEPNAAVNYATLSNVYSSQRRWPDVAWIRAMMRRNCGHKSPGWSCVEIGCGVHTFVSSDRSHLSSEEVYVVLGLLARVIEEELFVSENSDFLMEEHN